MATFAQTKTANQLHLKVYLAFLARVVQKTWIISNMTSKILFLIFQSLNVTLLFSALFDQLEIRHRDQFAFSALLRSDFSLKLTHSLDSDLSPESG